MAKSNYSYNPNPRLSANQLAEIITATPTRRKSIITNAKYPKTVIVAQYRDAYEHLVSFLTNSARTAPNFHSQISGLEDKAIDPSYSMWVQSDASRSAEALSKVHSAYNSTKLSSFDFRVLPKSKPKIAIEGVQVSPSAVCSVHGIFRKEPAVGCLSIFINKSESSVKARKERCMSAAVLSILYAEQHLPQFGFAAPKLNLSYDVLEGRLLSAPNTYSKRLSNMKFACEEVALRWPTVECPRDYDGPSH